MVGGMDICVKVKVRGSLTSKIWSGYLKLLHAVSVEVEGQLIIYFGICICKPMPRSKCVDFYSKHV